MVTKHAFRLVYTCNISSGHSKADIPICISGTWAADRNNHRLKKADNNCWEVLAEKTADNNCWEILGEKTADNNCWEILAEKNNGK